MPRATQVEDRLAVKLADGGAVRAFDVVGENLELRLGVDGRVVGQEQRLVGLLGVGLLGVLADEDLAVEDAVGLAVEDALVKLVTGAVRHGVVDAGVVVDVLLAVGHIKAVERAFAAFAREHGADFVAHQAAAQRDRVRREVAAAARAGLQRGEVKRLRAFALDLVMVDVTHWGRATISVTALVKVTPSSAPT